MSIRKIAVFLSVLSFLAVSCKDHRLADPDPEYLEGNIRFKIPTYVNPGDVYVLSPTGLEAPDGVDVGYVWYVTPTPAVRDTVRHIGDDASVTGDYIFEVPDTLTYLTITCTAFAEGYYSNSGSTSIVVVDPERTLTNMENSAVVNEFTDTRDGTGYGYFTAGKLDWLSDNLRYAGSGASFANSPAMDEIFGRYYSYDEALSSCPEGWRLPASEDWTDLASSLGATESSDRSFPGIAGNLMADGYFNGDKLWAYWPAVRISNSTGFGALPTGYAVATSTGNEFQGFPSYAAYWTAEEVDGDRAIYRYMFVEKPEVRAAIGHKDSFLATVRCVRESAD